ncbi:DNA polymerase III subunit delta [Acuticoccus sediminis]|uniref:DNA polymerase III subunit delta n=1 Tax=Acuticoccus sediminis TaxID=2184697 RepID=A0A8B2P088_9HYPH|nr:DNA polymerase III subunit delta [Acuticoccus sediminis]RAI03374.1 DNA polymerase III subunit delta [Acuticoccus sediminis]
MTAAKASEVGRRFTHRDKLPPVILVFGPDRGLVTEVSDAILALFADSDDPFAIVKLDAAAVASDPARLIDEAGTISMFGGKRLILVRDAAGRNMSPSVQPLLDHPPTDAVVVVEAGDLKRGTGLRKDVEGHARAVAVYCPADTGRDLDLMIEEEASKFGLTIDADARAVLRERLGADRAASRNEVVKACLHAAGGEAVTIADIDAVVGDVAASEIGEAVDAAFLGNRRALDAVLARVLRQDSAAVQILMMAQRVSHALELASVAVAAGASPTRAVEDVRPPLFGSHRTMAPRALDIWPPGKLRAASEAIAEATFRTRIMPHLAAATTRDVLMRIASQVSRR